MQRKTGTLLLAITVPLPTVISEQIYHAPNAMKKAFVLDVFVSTKILGSMCMLKSKNSLIQHQFQH